MIYFFACPDNFFQVVVGWESLNSGQCFATISLLNSNVDKTVFGWKKIIKLSSSGEVKHVFVLPWTSSLAEPTASANGSEREKKLNIAKLTQIFKWNSRHFNWSVKRVYVYRNFTHRKNLSSGLTYEIKLT